MRGIEWNNTEKYLSFAICFSVFLIILQIYEEKQIANAAEWTEKKSSANLIFENRLSTHIFKGDIKTYFNVRKIIFQNKMFIRICDYVESLVKIPEYFLNMLFSVHFYCLMFHYLTFLK